MGVPSVAARHIARRRRRPRGGQPYNPLTAFEWKAAFYAGDPLWTPPADGDPVSSWRDGGSEGKNATQATGSKQPAYRASVAALNDKPAVQGDGVDDFLQTAAWSSALTAPYSIVAVVASATTGTDKRIVSPRTGLADLYRKNSTGTLSWASTPAGVVTINGPAMDAAGHLARVYVNGASTEVDLDGSQVTGNGAGTYDGATLFAYNGGGTPSGFADMHIAFIGVIAGDITADANWPAFVAWVESHYGLAVA